MSDSKQFQELVRELVSEEKEANKNPKGFRNLAQGWRFAHPG